MGDHVKKKPAGNDNEIPADHGDREPERDPFIEGKEDEGRGKKQFVCQGVQESAQCCLLICHPGDESVKQVCHPSEDKKEKSMLMFPVNDGCDEHRDKNDPGNGQRIGQIKNSQKTVLPAISVLGIDNSMLQWFREY
jgi:hypothetical protein